VRWDGRNNFGSKVTTGIYFYQLKAGNETQVKKMVFGLNSTNVIVSIPKIFYSRGTDLKEGANQTLSKKESDFVIRNFSVQIQNTDVTEPRILINKFENITLQSDTILNFTAESGKIIFVKLDTILYNNQYLHKTNIYKINIDGTGLEQITFNDTFDGFPIFTRDGKQLVFASNRFNKKKGDTNIFIADWID